MSKGEHRMTDIKTIGAKAPRLLDDQELLILGLEEIAYIRPVEMNGVAAFAVHAADGTPLAFHADAETARAIARQNDMHPMTVQ